MTRHTRSLGAGAAAALLLLTACSGSDTPADDVEPSDTLQSSTVDVEDGNTPAPSDSADE